MKQLLPQTPRGRWRQSGPRPTLSDSEVQAIEVVGLFLRHAQDKAAFDYFRRHHQALFPALAHLHRTTFTRQSTNLWRVKEQLWQHLLRQLPQHGALSFLDSCPYAAVPVPPSALASTARTPRA